MKHLDHHLAELFAPLADFYTTTSAEPPRVLLVPGPEVPPPYQSLLVHTRDMTSTLERFWDSRIHLQVIKKHDDGAILTRQVILVTDTDKRPVEFGAIRIHLHRFDEAARSEIVNGVLPLGAILERHQVEYSCHAQTFFLLEDDPVAQRVLSLNQPSILYGRQNRITKPTGELLADVVEILPPSPDPDAPSE